MTNEQQELEQIKRAVKESNKALSISEIKKQTRLEIEPRTLLRRLNKLVDQKIIKKIGKKRGAAYQIAFNANESEQQFELELIPLTEQSKEFLSLVNRPQTSRSPVGYEREFLKLYQPNVTSY